MDNSTIFGISVVILLIVGRSIFKLRKSLKSDKQFLSNNSLQNLISVLTERLNEYCYGGKGIINNIDEKSFSLYEQGSNQIIFFEYQGGNVYITWKYKYFQRELIYKMTLSHVKEATLEGQKKSAIHVIQEFNKALNKHKGE